MTCVDLKVPDPMKHILEQLELQNYNENQIYFSVKC